MRSAKEEQGVYWQRRDIGQTYLEIEQRRMTQPKRQSWNGLREETSVMSLNSIEENADSLQPLILLFSQTPNKSLLSFYTKDSYTQHHGHVGHIILCCVGFSYAL